MNPLEVMELADARQTQKVSNLVKEVGILRPDLALFAREIVNGERLALVVVVADIAIVIYGGVRGDFIGELNGDALPRGRREVGLYAHAPDWSRSCEVVEIARDTIEQFMGGAG